MKVLLIIVLSFISIHLSYSEPPVGSNYVETKPTKEELEWWEGIKRDLCEDLPPPVKEESYETFRSLSNPVVPWPSTNIPFVISSKFSTVARSEILRAMKRIENASCIRFYDMEFHPFDNNHINIERILCGFSSWHLMTCGFTIPVGYDLNAIKKGFSTVFINENCSPRNTPYTNTLHELFHVLGFIHEFERWDRDKYLELFQGDAKLYPKYRFEDDPVAKFGYTYDYKSIMNYGGFKARNPDIGYFGFPTELSDIDIKKLNLLYKCKS